MVILSSMRSKYIHPIVTKFGILVVSTAENHHQSTDASV